MVKRVGKIIKKIIIIMVIIQATLIPISNALSFEEIIQQGDKFINEGKDNQILYEYETDENGNKKLDEDGNPIIKKDANGNPIPVLDKDGNPVKILNETLLSQTIESVYNILLAIGIAVSVGAGAAMGIKFMAGSVEEQAKIKEMLIPYAIGCIVVFGGFGIWKIVMNLAGDIFI